MVMSPTAEAIQSYGHIKLQSDGAIQAFSDMITSGDSKLTCGNILSSDGKHYIKSPYMRKWELLKINILEV